jgi:hypothetical protein
LFDTPMISEFSTVSVKQFGYNDQVRKIEEV